MLYDVIIIGGGPAGCAAAVYAARKRLKTLLITESFGGQSIVSDDIQNWIGEPHISGFDLAKKFEAHVRAFSDMVDIKIPERVTEIKSIKCLAGEERICDFEVATDKENKYEGKSIILTAGARRRKLNISGEDKFEGKGVAYCSTCDAPLFSGKKVAVVGGGNAGLEAVIDLFPYANEVFIMEYADNLKGDPVTQEEVKKNPKLKEIIFNAKTVEVLGDKFVTGIKYQNTKTGEEKVLEVEGIFVEIGSVPNSEMAKNLIDLDKYRQVIIDSKHSSTSHPGIFAAGDITDDPYKQNNISAGDAVKAALAAYNYLLKRSKTTPAAE
ncbi:MAG: alkyl hydroperoxide reductase subunit F [Candidatus Giovannonibacteria bacterium GW2011_GWB1_45_9b]|uniref:Alkyl hydroperoxide reductase subunit F n=1 Tax=Candidatus Giovannonibacteria bacterium GW2011_GWB1_45_9b TaxID=1618653 RepID=A0A0G1N8J9_9BACT|nr:MAG: alkyl hydroperoxide reductase subunit F [Candidatus Giovannonibacteria bacterium GW2011_GWB1_45_9b]